MIKTLEIMKRKRTLKRSIVMILFLIITLITEAQNDKCQVLLDRISKEYTGDCENGLANGKGKATGEDIYVGTFKNGDIFQGNWIEGKKEGKGSFTYFVNGKKQVLTGYWQNDEYAGQTKPDIKYRVTSTTGIFKYTITENAKLSENEDVIVFTIKSAFTNFMPKDLKVENSNGELFQTGKIFGVRNYLYPLHCEISYTILVAESRKQCHFIVDILKKGYYEVTLYND